MTKHRVLHLLQAPDRRGATMFTARLVQQLQTEHLDNTVCTFYQTPGEKEMPFSPAKFVKLDVGLPHLHYAAGFDPRVALRLAKVLRRIRPCLVVAYTTTLKYCLLAKLARPSTATIYYSGGMASAWARSSSKQWFNRALLRGVDKVVCVSRHGQSDFLAHYRVAPQKVCFIPNGVDLSAFDEVEMSRFRSEMRKELGLDGRQLALVTVGNLSWEKNQAVLLPIVRHLRVSGIDAHLVVVGDGPLLGKLRQTAANLGVSSSVHLLGLTSNVPRILAACDLFVLPSKTESMPAVLIEAGLAGLASAAYDVGGVAEVIHQGETGLLAPPDDFQTLQHAVETLSRDQTRRYMMGKAARRRGQELFDIRRVAREYETLIMQTLHCKAGKDNGHT